MDLGNGTISEFVTNLEKIDFKQKTTFTINKKAASTTYNKNHKPPIEYKYLEA